MHEPLPVARYYDASAVRARMREYCGETHAHAMSCVYLAAMASPADAWRDWEHAPPHPPSEFDALVAHGADLARSLWDRESLLVHLDLDYLNVDEPGEPFHHPVETFYKLEPTLQAVRSVMRELDLRLFTLMTGRGYHFTGRVPLNAPAVSALAALAPEAPGWFATRSSRLPPWLADGMDERTARAYIGHGLVTEWLGHLVMRRAVPRSPIPVVFNGTIVGTGVAGRECVSIDLSASGDPMDTRHIRLAYSTYQRHRFRPDVFGPRAAGLVGPLASLPRDDDDSTWDFLARGRDLATAAELAAASHSRLPEVTAGLARAIAAYEESPLAAFHRRFFAEPPDTNAAAAARFSEANPESLPPCVVASLVRPNDLLLQPAHIQHVTRYLLAEGWHPRHVAGLVFGRYSAPFGWGDRWERLDARTRAEFDVRVFAGMIETGLDRGVDFNCRSAQEKDLCPRESCAHDLRLDREHLLQRTTS
ncbi:MAG: hypothetical protein ACM3SQ_00595 [Betaproteobacteria bacterium]